MNIGYIVLLCIVDVGLFATKSLITFALFCFGMHIVFKNKKPELKTQPKEKQFVSEFGRLSKEYKAVQHARRLHKQLELRKSIDTEHDRSRKMMRELSMEEILSTTNTGNNNTGTGNSGRGNSGSGNSGHRNSGNGNSGDWNSGHRNSGTGNSGHRNSGNGNSGDWNSGHRNSGTGNSGHENSGHRNSGDWNSGHRNSGTGNSGCENSGYRNSGDWNSGHGNSGNGNSGSWNSGHRNSGSWNSGSFCSCNNSSGFFMSKRISYEAFNKSLSEEEYRDLIRSEGFRILSGFKLYAYKEKDVLSRLRYLPYKTSWKMFWQTLTPKEKLTVKRMPHFDAQVFYEITGIKLGKVIGLNYEK